MRHKRYIIMLLVLTMLFTSGCWDKVEIEERAFVNTIAVDLVDKQDEENQGEKSTVFCEEKTKKIKVIFGLLNPSKIQEGEGAFVPSTVEGVNFSDAMEELGARTSRFPYYGQTRLLVLGEKLLKDEKTFREVLDHFERKAIINQQMKVVVVKGEIENTLKVEPKIENSVSGYVGGILDNSRVLSYTVDMDLSQLLSSIRNGEGSTAIPVIEIETLPDRLRINIDTLALIKDYKFLTYLDTKYIKTYKILNEELKSGRKLVEYKDMVVPYYIFQSSRKIWLEDSGDKLKYKVKVQLEGDIEEFEFDRSVFDNETIQEISKAVEKSMKLELETATRYFQDIVLHDYLGFKEYTQKYHNKVYKKYEKNWDEQFKKAEIEYEVQADIRRVGTSKQ